MSTPVTRVYIEETSRSSFAVALEWPGWCRRAKTADLALDSLMDYQDRYAQIVSRDFRVGTIRVVDTLLGNATTDFGAPDARGSWDTKPLTRAESSRQLGLIEDCWSYFDHVALSAPATLRKGRRGRTRPRRRYRSRSRSRARLRLTDRHESPPANRLARPSRRHPRAAAPGVDESQVAHPLRDTAPGLARHRSRVGDPGSQRLTRSRWPA